ENEQVRLVILRNAGARKKTDDSAVGSVETGAFVSPLREEFVAIRIPRRRTMERRILQQRKRLLGLGNDSDLVAILQVPSHARQWNANRYAQTFQNVPGSNARQHQKLRR